jgi:pyruvate/2-oxoglutarate dehydrogenase complex dihydrolipoamide acyltransferase (E2) component
MSEDQKNYTVKPFPKVRQFYIDTFAIRERKHMVHGLIEVDVTNPRRFIRAHKAKTGVQLSFTAFVITCLGKAIDANKYMHAYRNWRGQLILFDDVHVSTMFEVEVDGVKIPMGRVIKAVNKRSFREIHDEIRNFQLERQQDQSMPYERLLELYTLVPGFIRRFFLKLILKNPHWINERVGTVGLTAVGMLGQGSGWGITLPFHTLVVTLGGIAEKPAVIAGQIEIREYLNVTLSFDHDIIDGGPATRFTQRFKELIESGYRLMEDEP